MLNSAKVEDVVEVGGELGKPENNTWNNSQKCKPKNKVYEAKWMHKKSIAKKSKDEI